MSRRLGGVATARLITDLVDACNSRDQGRVAALHSPEYEGVDVGQAMPQRGPEGVQESLARYWHAFPDLHLTQEQLIVQGNQGALVWTARGTHLGKFMNIPPTGRQVEVWGVSLYIFAEGKANRGLHVWDVAGLLRALGLLPEL